MALTFAFLLGLLGSLGHCVGMCSGVTLLLSRRGVTSSWYGLLAHLGRIITYSLLGLGAGILGHSLELTLPALRQVQGILALSAAAMAGYLALAMLGRVPSPEIFLADLTRRWGQAMRSITTAGMWGDGRQSGSPWLALVAGLLWGLLPCGLVLTALLPAASTGSPVQGALSMLAFGVGTWPALLSVSWAARRPFARAIPWPRWAAALIILLFGTQMALRGLAIWGWVSHLRVGNFMLW